MPIESEITLESSGNKILLVRVFDDDGELCVGTDFPRRSEAVKESWTFGVVERVQDWLFELVVRRVPHS